MTNGQAIIREITASKKRLLAISEDDASKRPIPDKWTKKEILGHLVDSACNNHRRFVIATAQNNLVFDQYDQNHWVSFKHYQRMPWETVVNLWHDYNLLMAHLVDQIPASTLYRETTDHNFDRVAFRTIPAGKSTNLDYFIKDYLAHMQHHIRQILDI